MTQPRRRIGRPRSATASAHDAIIAAVHELLQTVSVQDLTIEGIARRAGVGKPTLYKWWGTKADIVLAMVKERVEPSLDPPADLSLEASVQFKARRLVDAFNGFFGRVMAGLIAEAQHDPDLQIRINQAYILPRRAGTIADIRKAQSDGTFPAEIDPEIIVDQVFGCLYFHLLTGVHPLTHAYADQLVETVFSPARRKA
jgi:AcrR family transcriptional regulator